MNRVLSRLTRAVAASDGQLLDAFLAERSEAAFRELVARHGELVFAVCNRVLRHRQDAEDAFQAVFLVLARRAAAVWPREALGAWLHGVAHRVALKARALRARRRVCEQPLGEQSPPSPPASAALDLAELIDAAVRKLPEVYRAAVVACDLEGLSRAEAATRLGWKEGTLSGRLARARKLLADRLRRSGVTVPAAGVGVALDQPAVAEEVVAETVRLAVGCGGGNLAAGVSGSVAVLTEGVVRGMFLAKIKAAAVAVVAVGVFGVGVWAASGTGDGQGPGKAPGSQPNPAATAKAQGKQPALDLDVARGNLEVARKHLAETLKDQQDRVKRGDWPVDTADQLERELARFRADVEMLQNLLKSSQTALDAAKAAGPAVKVSGDLARMQGRWRLESRWDGTRQQVVPAQGAPMFEIVGDKWYGPIRGDEKRPEKPLHALTLRPDKTPAEIDLAPQSGELPEARGIYRFAAQTEPRSGNLWIAVANKGGPRPTSFDPKGGDIELMEFARVGPAEAGEAKPRVVEGVNLTPAEQRRELALQELQILIAENNNRRPATTVDQFADQLERDKLRVAALQNLLEQAQKELDREKARAKAGERPKPGTDLIDEAKARDEILRQQLQTELDVAMRQAMIAEVEFQQATAAVQEAQKQLNKARGAIVATRRALTALGAEEKPPAALEIRDDKGNRVAFPESAVAGVTDLAAAMLAGSRGELTGGKDTPFATRERWQQLQKAGHVLVRFPKKRAFANVAGFEVEEILIPVSGTRSPEFILVRSGDKYRAFFDFPAEHAKRLQQVLAALAK